MFSSFSISSNIIRVGRVCRCRIPRIFMPEPFAAYLMPLLSTNSPSCQSSPFIFPNNHLIFGLFSNSSLSALMNSAACVYVSLIITMNSSCSKQPAQSGYVMSTVVDFACPRGAITPMRRLFLSLIKSNISLWNGGVSSGKYGRAINQPNRWMFSRRLNIANKYCRSLFLSVSQYFSHSRTISSLVRLFKDGCSEFFVINITLLFRFFQF